MNSWEHFSFQFEKSLQFLYLYEMFAVTEYEELLNTMTRNCSEKAYALHVGCCNITTT